jgi:macrolide-specific efflux system membrane fusion protein
MNNSRFIKMNMLIKNKWFLTTLLILVVLAFYYLHHSSNEEGMEEEEYSEYTVARGDIDLNILSTGVIQPQNKLEIKPPISGRAEKILVDEGTFVKKNQIIAWMSSIDRATLLDAARAKGDSAVKEWVEYYPATPIMAPIDGTIIKKSIENGQTFTYHDSIFTMSNRLTVKAQVDETDISLIKINQKALITLDAYQDRPIEGKVDRIAYDATTVNNVTTYIVDVIPSTIPDFMRSGMTTNVNFHILSKKNVLFLPSNAMKMKAGKYLVTIESNGKKFEKEVEVGVSDGKKTEILKGLIEGDVILVPQFRLKKESGQNNSSPFSSMSNEVKE